MVFDGPAPACKKSWLDRSQVGSDSDPVRGSAARALRRQLGNEGVNVVLAPWEEDYYNVMQAA